MSDSKYQETVAHEDDGDLKENDQPATANLTRAMEVAEELLQAIKQAIPTPTGKQSVLVLLSTSLHFSTPSLECDGHMAS